MRAGRLARLCVVPALAGLFLIAAAAPAWAHAILSTADPPKDGVAAQSPSQLTLTFNENVEVSFGAIRVYTCAGQRITTGAPKHSAETDRTVHVSVPKLDPGVYLVAWRVISADAHPVGGTYSFRIGPGGPPSVSGCATETNAESSSTVGVLFGIARVGVFAGLALLIGGVVFLVAIAAGTSAVRWTRRLIWIGWVILLVTTIAAVMLQGPYAAGAGIGDATQVDRHPRGVADTVRARRRTPVVVARGRARVAVLPRPRRRNEAHADVVAGGRGDRRHRTRRDARAPPAMPRPASGRSSPRRSTQSTSSP